MSKVLVSEVEYTRYNTVYKVENQSKEEIARLVADIICKEYEKVLIERRVKENFSILDDYEKKEIIKETLIVASEEKGKNFPGREKRRKDVENEIISYFDENESIIPKGFVDFRYRNLYFYVEKIVDEGAKRYFDRQEYEEFIYLLKMFVNSREIKEKAIHVIWKDGGVRLYNKRGRDVTDKYQKDFLIEAEKKKLNCEDLAISAVIAASPEALILHTPPQSPLAQALEKIYTDRVRICTGCDICKKG